MDNEERQQSSGRGGRPAVFLDLNGTLVLPVRAASPDEFVLIPGCAGALALLGAAGFLCPVITVQSRIAKGVYTEEAFRRWFARFQGMLRREAGVDIVVGPYLCPHRAADACACAKPRPLLYQVASEEHGIDCSRSFVVGDTPGDVRAAAAIGAAGGCFVRTGWGPKPGADEEREAVFVGNDLLAVARWIVERQIR